MVFGNGAELGAVATGSSATGVVDYRYKALGAAGLYFGILGFNLFMTFWGCVPPD
ncbi:MAG: hypothetical protein ACKVZH_18910 [Blastocatellia bacterium]